MVRMLSSFSSGKWCESGNSCESFMPLSIIRCNGFGKKKQIKVSVRTALAQESLMIALDWID